MLKFLLFSLCLYCQYLEVLSHVALTFPAARTYKFDYLDNYRFGRKGPCGEPKTPGAPAITLIAGSNITVTWHLSYPHKGGSKLELIRESGDSYNVVAELTNGFDFADDTVKQDARVTLPEGECRDCSIRLIRQGTEYSQSYAFWSCADVSIVTCNSVAGPPPSLTPQNAFIKGLLQALKPGPNKGNAVGYNNLLAYIRRQNIVLDTEETTCTAEDPGCYDGKCLNGGTCESMNGECKCHRLFAGSRCQYKDECWTDEDCNYHGECIDTRATTHPKLKCYCERGWFGVECDRVSEITEIRSDYETNPNYMSRELARGGDANIYWTYVKDNSEIEVVMRVRTHSWVGVGWKSTSTTTRCKNLEPVLEVEAKHTEAQRQLLLRQANFTTTEPNPHRDPEIDVENMLGSNLEIQCARGSRKKRAAERVKRQTYNRVFSGMDCADITVGSVKGNLTRVQDMWTRDCSVPLPDAYFGGTDDITSAYGTQENGFTTIAFRKRLTVNHFTDHAANAGLQRVIWARGQDVNVYAHSPPTGLDLCQASDFRFYRHDELKYHGGDRNRRNKGSAQFRFTRPTPPSSTAATTATTAASATTAAACTTSGQFKSPANCISTVAGFNCDYFVSWQLNNDIITFTLKATQDAGNYVALGISNDIFMANTDIYSGFIMSNGQYVVQDRYATRQSLPPIDQLQNVTPISGNYNNGVLSIVFSRPRTSTNSFDIGFERCRHLFFAEGPVRDGNIAYHSFRRVLTSTKLCIEPCTE